MKLAFTLILCFSLVVVICSKRVYDEYIDDILPIAGGRQVVVLDGGQTETVKWIKCVSSVNSGVITFRNFIGRIEEVLSRLMQTSFKILTFIPVTIAKIAIALASKVIRVLLRAKWALEKFFGSIFGMLARALHGTIVEMHDIVHRISNWGHRCVKSQGKDCTHLPHVGGYGPCGGVFPCKVTVVCFKPVCLEAVNSQIDSDENGGLHGLNDASVPIVGLPGKNGTSDQLGSPRERNETSGHLGPPQKHNHTSTRSTKKRHHLKN